MKYKQLTRKERYQISYLKSMGFKKKVIAQTLGRHVSTIYRELKRNKDHRGYYFARKAHEFAVARREDNGKRAIRISETVWGYIEYKLEEQWSPEQISHFSGVSHEHIYQYVYKNKQQGGDLYLNLRQKRSRRRNKRLSRYQNRGRIINAVSIDKRPKIVDKRCRIGDFEIDTIIGGNRKQALVSIVERKTGFAFIKRVNRKTANAVKDAIIDLLKPIKHRIKTITSDNGSEFAEHQAIASSLDCRYYFAHPYSSWERGSNENLNGLIRQYFPKKMVFDSISDEEIKAVENRLNHRPRKRLKYKTPYEAFFKLDSHLDVELRL